MRTIPAEERSFRGRIDALLAKRGGAIVPTEEKPLGMDLGPFFEAWGVPTSQAARDAVHGLPTWMPEGLR